MMKRHFVLLAVLLMTALAMHAQKKMYVPDEWRNPWPSDSLLYAENDPDNKYTWSKSRSVESDNVIVLWDKGFSADLGYPATVELTDGSLLTVFYAEEEAGGPCVIRQIRWRLVQSS